MKRLILLALLCIGAGLNSKSAMAQTDTSYVNDKTHVVVMERKVLETYPAPTPDADPIKVVHAVRNGTPYVEHYLENSWSWRFGYIDKIYRMDYQTNTWHKPILQTVHEEVITQKILFLICVVTFFLGFFYGKKLHKKANSFILVFFVAEVYLLWLNVIDVYTYMGPDYNIRAHGFVPSVSLSLVLTGCLWIGIVFNKIVFKKKVQNLTELVEPMGVDS